MTEDYYSTPPEKRVACNVRLPRSLKTRLHATVRLWEIMAVLEGHNPDAIDLTYVFERFLRVGVDGVWDQVKATTGFERVPQSEESWDKLREALKSAPRRPGRGRPRRTRH